MTGGHGCDEGRSSAIEGPTTVEIEKRPLHPLAGYVEPVVDASLLPLVSMWLRDSREAMRKILRKEGK